MGGGGHLWYSDSGLDCGSTGRANQSCTRGMFHNKIHLISPGCPWSSIALQIQNDALKHLPSQHVQPMQSFYYDQRCNPLTFQKYIYDYIWLCLKIFVFVTSVSISQLNMLAIHSNYTKLRTCSHSNYL